MTTLPGSYLLNRPLTTGCSGQHFGAAAEPVVSGRQCGRQSFAESATKTCGRLMPLRPPDGLPRWSRFRLRRTADVAVGNETASTLPSGR